MKYLEYTSLIQKLEKYAAENPGGYRLRVAALGALGYAYFAGLILLFVLLPVAAVLVLIAVPKLIFIILQFAGKLIWLALIGLGSFLTMFWGVVKSLWVKTPGPEGHEIKREDAPGLFELIDEICVFLKASRPDQVLLTEEFNAAVVTLPRYGLFGKKIFLIIGLPLIQAVSPEQFRAILAHEVGHISGKHGSYSTWIYRIQETWNRFLNSQEAGGYRLSFLYKKFLDWYFPYFSAYSFVLCRQHECEADEYAVQYAGAKAMGEALINTEIKGRDLAQGFWKEVLEEAGREKSPPKEIFTRIAMAFRQSDKPREIMALSKAVAVNTDYSDTHPSLSERLKRIGYWISGDLPNLPGEIRETAAALYLGPSEQKFLNIFDAAWEERVREDWLMRHDHLLEVEKKLEELKEKEKSEGLNADQLFEKADLIAERYGEKEAKAVLFDLIKSHPDHAGAQFGMGAILLAEEDENGLEYLERAISLDKTISISAFERIYYFLKSKGRDREAEAYAIKIEEEHEILSHAESERSAVMPEDQFQPHSIGEDILEKIRSKFEYYEDILAAYLVRKSVRFYPEVPFHVLFLDTRKKGFLGKNAELNTQEILDSMAEGLSEFGIHYFVVIEQNFADVIPKLDRIENSRIYKR